MARTWGEKGTLETRRFFWIALAGLLASAGCGGGGGGLSSGDSDPTFIYVNGSPDAGPIDFYVDSKRKASGIPYGARSDQPSEMDSGDYDFEIRLAGGIESHDTIGSISEVNKHYLVGAFGKLAFGDDAMQRLRVQAWQFDRTVPNGDKARLLVANGLVPMPGFEPPPIDFQDGTLPQFKFNDVPFGDIQSQLVDSGTFTFDARTDNAEAVFVSKSLTLERGKVYIALVTGIEGETAPQEPRITLIEIPTAP